MKPEMMKFDAKKLNEAIEQFPQVFKFEEGMELLTGVSRLVMLDRYSFKDSKLLTLQEGDLVVATIKDDPKFPARGTGIVTHIDRNKRLVTFLVDEEFKHTVAEEYPDGLITKRLEEIDKPLEMSLSQIAKRVAKGLSIVEKEEKRKAVEKELACQIGEGKLIPAGRVLHGAGSGTNVTYFNCYVMPYVPDSREGIADHRKHIKEIMSRGGGVGTNGSTLRPRNTLAKGVSGKSSGAVSWLNDLANLTHLVEQGGSRRGAQMIMMDVSHPDIIEFIVSKMQNPDILRYLIQESKESLVVKMAKEKLKFTPHSMAETALYESVAATASLHPAEVVKMAKQKLSDGGVYSVHQPEFLAGANISVTLTEDFMKAVEEKTMFALKFPDVENYNQEQMKAYNHHWHEIGDVREWEALGYPVRTYAEVDANELWELINVCATYSAEPGVFFLDNANQMTNAAAYGQKVVATNPCGEQPLAPHSVCNLSALNLSKFSTPQKTVDFKQLEETVRVAVRMGDNVVDATPYFLDENKKQALGERRVGLGVMGLHDLLIQCEAVYGSEKGNQIVDEVFECIATTAYRTSIDLAKEKGSFPFLIGKTEEETTHLRQAFINTGYMKKMPEDIRQGVLSHGIRNSHLLTVAPTGSTGTMVGVSTGLEPYFSFSYYRSGRLGQFIPVVADIALKWLTENNYEGTIENMDHLPDWFVSAMELSPEAHADVQCLIQRWVDSSISKTVNAPKGYTVDQVKKVYERLWKGGAKGGTVYVDGSRDAQVLSLTKGEDEPEEEVSSLVSEKRVETTSSYVVFLEGKEREIGNDVGNACSICRKGVLVDMGGCATCSNCQASVKCGI